jgi:metal-dependent amidase/aminoacylase/carboxypeptidase family protein
MKADLHGTVKFIFQPAEEGVLPGELKDGKKSGAEQMVKPRACWKTLRLM